MREPFDKLPLDKRESIIRLSVAEFANKNYTDASTDDIVVNVGISKGSLFYYFKNKKGLYLYILKDSIERILSVAEQRVNLDNGAKNALIERFFVRVKFCRENPEIVRFIQRAAHELSYEVYEEKQKIMNEYIDRYDKSADYVINYFVENTPLKVDMQTAYDVLYMFWSGISMFMLDRYKQEPERVFCEDNVLKDKICAYFVSIFDGICK